MVVGLESWTLARPELFLAAVTCLLLVYGVVRGEVATPFVSAATSLALLVTAVLLFMPYREGTAFATLFIADRLTTTMKALVLVGAAITVLMSRAYFEQDAELLGRILAPEFQRVDSDGNWSTRAQELDWVSKNKPAYDSLTFKIRRLDIFDNGTAIVAGTGTIRGRDENGPYVAEYESTNVLIKRDGAWQAIASHTSGDRKIE